MSLLSDDSVSVAQASKLQTGTLSTPLVIQPHVYISTTTYSFAANGGAIGAIYLPLSVPVPIRSIYVGIIGEHVIQVASGGAATIALDLVDNNTVPVMVNSILGATAYNAAGGLFTGAANTVGYSSPAAANNALPKQTLAANYLRFTIAGATLTAGSMIFAVQYVL